MITFPPEIKEICGADICFVLDIPANQKTQLENIMKKVMGVAYMPEDLTGQLMANSQKRFCFLSTMNITFCRKCDLTFQSMCES